MKAVASHETVLILDFGSQYVQLIARRVRELQVYSEIVPFTISAAEIRRRAPKGLIFSGGPASVYAEKAPRCDPEILRLGIPILGICYGMQLGSLLLGGDVKPTPAREYGRTTLRVLDSDKLFAGLPSELVVWNSHGDQVNAISEEFIPLGRTATCPYAAVRHRGSEFYGVQFHPEVSHTPLRQRHPAQLPPRRLRVQRRLADGRVHRERRRRLPRESRRRARRLRPLRRRGFLRRRHARPQSRSATGCTASSWTTACCGENEVGERAQHVPRPLRRGPGRRGRGGALPRQAARRDRPGAEAAHHRPHVHRGLPREGEDRSPALGSWRRARSTPT